MISMHQKYNYMIKFIPRKSNIIILYKSIRYKIRKSNKMDFMEAIDFLVDEIEEDCIKKVEYSRFNENYLSDYDENYEKHSLCVKKELSIIYEKMFYDEDYKKTVMKYLSLMRNVI